MTEREVVLTGIGGQGIQLAAQVLARAAACEDRHVSLFGVYSGSMRGGRTDSTVVVADRPIQAPPIISHAWSAIALHHLFWRPGPQSQGTEPKLTTDAVVLLNSSLFDLAVDRDRFRVFDVPATEMAIELGSELVSSMVMVGAYAGVTALVTLDGALEGMRQSVPSHRRQHLALNEAAIRAGYGAVALGAAPAWAPQAAQAVEEARG